MSISPGETISPVQSRVFTSPVTHAGRAPVPATSPSASHRSVT